MAGEAPLGAQDERVKELCRWLLFAALGGISDPGSDQDTLRFPVLTGERPLEAKLTAGPDDSGELGGPWTPRSVPVLPKSKNICD